MTLIGRVSAFFLIALALALLGAGVALFELSATYFSRRQDERLTAALDTICAAAEVHRRGIEWEPNTRNLSLGLDDAEDQVRWIVHDRDGVEVAQSPNFDGANLADARRWRVLSRIVAAPGVANSPRPMFKDGSLVLYDQLVLTAGISPLPDRAALNQLARALTGIGCVVWLGAAVGGRWLGRRALAPVRRMAAEAATMNAVDLDVRLQPAGTGDELDDLGAAFNGLLGRLEAAFERQRRFTGDAAHQLSTPLTVLLGQLEVALRRSRLAEEYRAAIEEAHAHAIRLRQIVEMLLFLARPEADAMLPATDVVDLNAWLMDHVSRWKSHPRAADLRVEVREDKVARAAVAPALLSQLLDNLLDNACKYSTAGTAVTIGLDTSAEGILLRVEDIGVGIPREDLAHIFEPFYRSPEARRLGKPGVGLGLAVARRIAEALGGMLTVESEPGRGSRFTLQLPAARA
jgi:two-component system, OmpR family, sensor kinase